jgi:hypothetical protein
MFLEKRETRQYHPGDLTTEIPNGTIVAAGVIQKQLCPDVLYFRVNGLKGADLRYDCDVCIPFWGADCHLQKVKIICADGNVTETKDSKVIELNVGPEANKGTCTTEELRQFLIDNANLNQVRQRITRCVYEINETIKSVVGEGYDSIEVQRRTSVLQIHLQDGARLELYFKEVLCDPLDNPCQTGFDDAPWITIGHNVMFSPPRKSTTLLTTGDIAGGSLTAEELQKIFEELQNNKSTQEQLAINKQQREELDRQMKAVKRSASRSRSTYYGVDILPLV